MSNWIQILLKALAMFLSVLAFTRLMGARNLARAVPYKFVSFTAIAVIGALISVNVVTNLVYGFIAMGVWVALPIILDYLSLKSKWVHDAVNGSEKIVIRQGKVMEDSLFQVRMTAEELLSSLRSKNVFNMADVEFAIMEPAGDINVYLKSDRKPVTAHDLGVKTAPRAEPQTVIMEGNILDGQLASAGLNRGWLNTKLEEMGIIPDNVFICQVDASGDLYLDLFDDAIQIPQPKVKELVYANIEKSHADLLKYALETKDENAKAMYEKNAGKLKILMEKLEPYLLR